MKIQLISKYISLFSIQPEDIHSIHDLLGIPKSMSTDIFSVFAIRMESSMNRMIGSYIIYDGDFLISLPITYFHIVEESIPKSWKSHTFEPGIYKYIEEISEQKIYDSYIDKTITVFGPECLLSTPFSIKYQLNDIDNMREKINDAYLKLIREVPDSNIAIWGEVANCPNWIGCPSCKNIYQENHFIAVTQCPECKIFMNNPFYENLHQ